MQPNANTKTYAITNTTQCHSLMSSVPPNTVPIHIQYKCNAIQYKDLYHYNIHVIWGFIWNAIQIQNWIEFCLLTNIPGSRMWNPHSMQIQIQIHKADHIYHKQANLYKSAS